MRSLLHIALFSMAAMTALGQVPAASPAGTPPVKTSAYMRPDKQERVDRYIKSMFGWTTIGKNIASAGISTWTDSPKEWGPHWSGFGKRFASNVGKGVIKNTTEFGLEEAFKLDSRYIRADHKSIGRRIGNALISPFIARNENGGRVFGFPRIAGIYASSIIAAETWYPARYGWRDGMRSGTISLGTTALFNLVKEFAHRR